MPTATTYLSEDIHNKIPKHEKIVRDKKINLGEFTVLAFLKTLATTKKQLLPVAFAILLTLFFLATEPAWGKPGGSDSDEKTMPEEPWDAHIQFTYLGQKKSSFKAAYSGTNSLSPDEENPYSFTSTLYFGARAWQGAEFYFNPEMISAFPASGLHGLGGLTNGEQQKSSTSQPVYYLARAYLRQSFSFGDEKLPVEASLNQMGGLVDKRRLVLTIGKISIVDIFDNNLYSHDARTQFANWSFLDSAAYDYAGDAQGYTLGATIEFYFDDWVFRAGRFEGPKESNGQALDPNVLDHYGDQIEIEHAHTFYDQPGKFRLLGFRNQEVMGNFEDAINFASVNGGTPDVANVRRLNIKYGYGISLEQSLSADLGVFFRASLSDGKSETYSFTEVENSITGGVVTNCNYWRRGLDRLGFAFAQNEITAIHQKYLAQSGLGAFIGDGQLNYRPERILEVIYNMNLYKTTWLSLGVQRIDNPAYNADRGPITVSTLRFHAEL